MLKNSIYILKFNYFISILWVFFLRSTLDNKCWKVENCWSIMGIHAQSSAFILKMWASIICDLSRGLLVSYSVHSQCYTKFTRLFTIKRRTSTYYSKKYFHFTTLAIAFIAFKALLYFWSGFNCLHNRNNRNNSRK